MITLQKIITIEQNQLDIGINFKFLCILSQTKSLSKFKASCVEFYNGILISKSNTNKKDDGKLILLHQTFN